MQGMNSIKVILLFTALIFGVIPLSAQVKSIEVYAIYWEVKMPFAIRMEKFEESSFIYYKNSVEDLYLLFYNYEDCKSKLNSYPEINNDGLLNSMVILHFDQGSSVKLYFDLKGNYYYDGKWHVKNCELYVNFFKYFSNVIIPEKILEECMSEYRGDFWYDYSD